uniref:hypothetical protein n=1 Tax=Okeania sp. SIO2F4 TaxID=2607790 RepID=UPI0025ECA5BF|nr:hypothetical protein [Okeania sp. SIO2F4]
MILEIFLSLPQIIDIEFLKVLIPIAKSNAILQLYFNSQIFTKIQSLFLTIISRLV